MLSILIVHHIIDGAEVVGAVKESFPALVLRLTPLHFAERGKSWKEHVLEMVVRCDVFCPKVCLHAEDAFLLLCCHAIGRRII